MHRAVRGKLEMAGRVLEFSKARPSDDPSYELVVGRLEDRLARAKALELSFAGGMLASREAARRRQRIRRVIHSQLLRYIVALGDAAAFQEGGPEPQLRLPDGSLPHQDFLTSAKLLLEKAEANRDLLASVGLSPTMLEDLGKQINAFEAETAALVLARREHILARAELVRMADELAASVAILDGINRYRYGNDPDTAAAWQTIRTIHGQVRPTAPPPAGSEGPPPEPGGTIAPAA
ncbi:MAG: hypothetical protein HOP28_11840 [Gemmatimonadales bacterium]|nr:hypothetical protein [Gemmatimonadales bacterium]